jgi:hypothetical protein
MFGDMTAAHFFFIPAVLLVGVVIGWILGSRAAADAYAAELRKRDARRSDAKGDERPLPPQRQTPGQHVG